MISALYVQENGCYYGIQDVDPWPESRDARLYAGPWPVVHPPCARWCRLAGLVEATWGYRRGEDGGCFEAALKAVRTWGGVLEHPAYSDAFAHFGLPIPRDKGGWQRGLCGGWSCHVEQWHYGHAAQKATWLYAFGVERLPSLRWGQTPDTAAAALVERWSSRGPPARMDVGAHSGGMSKRAGAAAGAYVSVNRAPALVSWCGNHVSSGEVRPRLGKKAASATPIPFRDMLLDMARSVRLP